MRGGIKDHLYTVVLGLYTVVCGSSEPLFSEDLEKMCSTEEIGHVAEKAPGMENGLYGLNPTIPRV